jgi:PAS domain S-box-containing protein
LIMRIRRQLAITVILAAVPVIAAVGTSRWFLVGGLLICLCLVAVSLIIVRSVTRRVRDLANAADAVSRGEFSRRIEVDSDSELSDLQGAFNRMAGKLEEEATRLEKEVRQHAEALDFAREQLQQEVAGRRQSEEQLAEYRTQLEQLVEQRTEDLQEANARLRREIAERQQAEDVLTVRGRYIAAVAQVGQVLLSDDQPDDWLGEVLRTLGEASGAGRCFMFRSHSAADGTPLVSQVAEWCAHGVVPQMGTPDLQNVDCSRPAFENWHQRLVSDQSIAGRVDAFPEPLRSFLQAHDVSSVLILPLWVNGTLGGLIGFDESLDGKSWGSTEVEFLRSAARMVSLAVERHQAAAALRDSMEQYYSIFSTAPNLIVAVDKRGIIVDCNNRCWAVLGYESGELVGKPLDMIVHPDSLEAVRESLRRTEDHGFLLDRRHRFIRRDGNLIDVMLNTSALTDASGAFTRAICIIEDVTGRLRDEKALRESRELLRATLESTADGILVVDDHGRVIHANGRFADMWRLPSEMVVAGDDGALPDFVHKQLVDPGVFLSRFRELCGSTSESLDTLCFKDGRVLERFSCPLVREDQSVGRVWSFRDVTERRQAEKALRETEERLRVKLDFILSPEQPAGEVSLLDLVDREFLQRMQDSFSRVTGVASVIVDLEGTVLTRPSNFSQVCALAQDTEEGLRRCTASDRARSEKSLTLRTPFQHKCLSCGFVDASAPIIVAGKHIADWLMGQVNVLGVDRAGIEQYAREIGADTERMLQAFETMPAMAPERFGETLDLLWYLAQEISSLSYNNLLLTRDVSERKRAEEALRESEKKYRSLFVNMLNGFAYWKLLVDDDGRVEDAVILEANAAFAGLVGLRHE